MYFLFLALQVQPGIPSFPAPAPDTIVLPDGTGNKI
jgi:hypothetical protein